MAVDLLGKMKDFWSSEAIQQLSVMLDEQPDRVGQALSLALPRFWPDCLIRSPERPTPTIWSIRSSTSPRRWRSSAAYRGC